MGSSSSVAQLAGKMGAAARALQDAPREGVREAGIVGKGILEASLPSRRMSGVGRSGARLGARFTQPMSQSNPSTIVSYTGPVHLLNTGAGPHLIGPKGWRRGRSKGRLKFTGGDGGIRSGVVLHPGTRSSSKKFAPGAMRKVIAAAPKQIEQATSRALRSVF